MGNGVIIVHTTPPTFRKLAPSSQKLALAKQVASTGVVGAAGLQTRPQIVPAVNLVEVAHEPANILNRAVIL